MATVQPNPIEGLYGVRGELNGRGIDNNRIGFNKNTGFVTIDGQNFIKPQTITKDNLSYADPTAFNQQYNAFTSQNKLNSAQSNYEKALTQPVTNPYDTKINDTMSQFYDKIMNQKPYDPYSSPEYAAYEAQAQRDAHQGIRAAQESMGAASFGRSTNLAERAQGIQNSANEYLKTQVVPQLIAANQAQQQQEIANLGNYLERLTGQQGQFDTRSQQGLQNSLNFLNYLQGNRNQYANEQYQTGRDLTADKQNNFNAAIDVANITGKLVNPQTDYSGLYRQANNPNTPNTMAGQQQALQNAWAESENTGFISDSLARLTGLPAGTPTLQARQYVENLALDQAQFQRSLNNDSYDRNMDIYKDQQKNTQSAQDYYSVVKGMTQRDDTGKLSNPDEVEAFILETGLSGPEMKKLYLNAGLPLPDFLKN